MTEDLSTSHEAEMLGPEESCCLKAQIRYEGRNVISLFQQFLTICVCCKKMEKVMLCASCDLKCISRTEKLNSNVYKKIARLAVYVNKVACRQGGGHKKYHPICGDRSPARLTTLQKLHWKWLTWKGICWFPYQAETLYRKMQRAQ